MSLREKQLQALSQFFEANAKVAREFRREYESATWQATEGAVRLDPDGVADYAEEAVRAIGRLPDEMRQR